MWRVDILVRSIAFEDAREMAEALAHCVPRERAAAMHVRDAKTLLPSTTSDIQRHCQEVLFNLVVMVDETANSTEAVA